MKSQNVRANARIMPQIQNLFLMPALIAGFVLVLAGRVEAQNSIVYAIAVDGSGDVYVGGSFTGIGTVVATNIVARWNGSTWSSLASDIDDWVDALVVSGTNLYAGGGFTTIGGVTANGIAQWNGSAWSAGLRAGLRSCCAGGERDQSLRRGIDRTGRRLRRAMERQRLVGLVLSGG